MFAQNKVQFQIHPVRSHYHKVQYVYCIVKYFLTVTRDGLVHHLLTQNDNDKTHHQNPLSMHDTTGTYNFCSCLVLPLTTG